MKLYASVAVILLLALGLLGWVFHKGMQQFDPQFTRNAQTKKEAVAPPAAKDDFRSLLAEQSRRRPAQRLEQVVRPRPLPEIVEVAEEVIEEPIASQLELSDDVPDAYTGVLRTELPEAMFEGTKEPIKLDNLEKIEQRQKPVPVPPGVTLLSQDRPVTASDDLPLIGDLEYITDGDKDAADGSYVELAQGQQWVQIDLGAMREVHAVWVWHFHKSPRAYVDVVVQLSNDPEFASADTLTIYNADHDNTSGLGQGTDKAYVETNRGRVMPAGASNARYVRLYSNGNTENAANHYIEVEVWGREVQANVVQSF